MLEKEVVYGTDILSWILTAPIRQNMVEAPIGALLPRVEGDEEICKMSTCLRSFALAAEAVKTSVCQRAEDVENYLIKDLETLNSEFAGLAFPAITIVGVLVATQTRLDIALAGRDYREFDMYGLSEDGYIVGYKDASTLVLLADALKEKEKDNPFIFSS